MHRVIAWTFAVLGLLTPISAQAQAALTLEAKIRLGDVKGRIDHLAVDPKRKRLFVAELGNNSVAVVDINLGKVIQRISDLKEPQGIGYVAASDTVYVASGGDGTLRMFAGENLASVGRIDLGDDADNIRVDEPAGRVYVGYGSGAIAVIEAAKRSKVADIALSAHPESFQLDARTRRIFVNVPAKRSIAVVDRDAGRELTSWPTGNGTHFAMALDHEANRLFIAFREPARIRVLGRENGQSLANVETCGDIDDMFLDARRRRLYVSCGEGFVDVLDTSGSTFARLGRVSTVAGARTSLFVADLDRFFVAARQTPDEGAAVLVFRPDP
jgi:DNA-binding beta-propeller fold protein YncE